jgi:hypothetical protein
MGRAVTERAAQRVAHVKQRRLACPGRHGSQGCEHPALWAGDQSRTPGGWSESAINKRTPPRFV